MFHTLCLLLDNISRAIKLVLVGNGLITVTKDKEPVKSMTEIQLDLLLSFIGPSAIIKLPKFNLMIKWDKRVSVLKNLIERAKITKIISVER
jgi:hypothetical protein